MDKHIIDSPLHSRNRFRNGYDFEKLFETNPSFKQYVIKNKFGISTINFNNAEAVISLNKSLLFTYFNLKFWEFPEGYLCPPIPGRADYIHYLADLLKSSNYNCLPLKTTINVLDVGVGANAIYPIIGSYEYGWSFVGIDTDEIAFESAKIIIANNNGLKSKVDCRLQPNRAKIFENIILENDYFDLTLCNPPFYKSIEEANNTNALKNKNLGLKNKNNFGGKNNELWCEGGEAKFINDMVYESKAFANQVFWFTCLVSKKEHLKDIYNTLKAKAAVNIKTIEMKQGNKISRFVAWSFLNEKQIATWQKLRWNKSK